MGNEWYYTKNGQQKGPVSTEELKRLAGSGQIQTTDFIWRQRMPQWAQAGQCIKALLPAAPVAANINNDGLSVDRATMAVKPSRGVKRLKKKLAIRLVWSGMAAACLLGALALAARYFSSSGLDNEQRFFPDDTRIVVSVKVDEILNSDGYKQLEEKVPFFREAFRDADPSSWVSLLTKDISRVTCGGLLA